jgi:fructose-1,6-bisphosphatase/inositol monophosphatase family enzyme
MITEAGGRIGTLTGEPYTGGHNIAAGNPKVYAALLEAIAPHVPAGMQ